MEEQPVKFIRLSTGEDLVSEILEVNEAGQDNYYTLYNPFKIVYLSGRKPGSYSISLMQWVFPKICSNQEFNISKKDVIVISDINEDLIEYYWETINHYDNEVSDKKIKVEEDISSEEMMDIIQEYISNNKRTVH